MARRNMSFRGWGTPKGDIVMGYPDGPDIKWSDGSVHPRIIAVAQHEGDKLRQLLGVKRLTPRYSR